MTMEYMAERAAKSTTATGCPRMRWRLARGLALRRLALRGLINWRTLRRWNLRTLVDLRGLANLRTLRCLW